MKKETKTLKERIIETKTEQTTTITVLTLPRDVENAIGRYMYNRADPDEQWQCDEDGLNAMLVETLENVFDYCKGRKKDREVRKKLRQVLDACEELGIDRFAIAWENL